ncbi:MAG: hypothetical protein FWF42_01755 [Streptococcaceae bacterium]|nr:hypothetical protein [Streptococcaceae bacterium]MCL2858394.1 hypothetical protein [Streptococcaceae bacterium]
MKKITIWMALLFIMAGSSGVVAHATTQGTSNGTGTANFFQGDSKPKPPTDVLPPAEKGDLPKPKLPNTGPTIPDTGDQHSTYTVPMSALGILALSGLFIKLKKSV